MNRKIIFMALIGLIPLLLLALAFLLSGTPRSDVSPTKDSTPSNSPTINIAAQPTNIYALQKATIGQSEEDKLSQLPFLKEKRNLPTGQIEYLYSSPQVTRDNSVITQNGITVFERVITEMDNKKLPIIDDYKTRYGQPDKEIIGSEYYGRFETLYLYASKGFALLANPFTGEIDEIHTFQPTSIELYLNQWGSDVKENQNDTE
jgi:hypothetical protein